MVNYKVVDEALEKLKAWEKTCATDNGIRHLMSGGHTESINAWYVDMEKRRTPEQRYAEQRQKEAWDEYDPLRKKANKLIKEAQKSKSYPRWGIEGYEGVWETFAAPNEDLASKFLQIRDNRTKSNYTIISVDEIRPAVEQMSFGA